jgi:hypothetical protein
MTKRKLKLPDGGTLDLPIPSGFGAPILALNDASTSPRKRIWLVYALGALTGILTVWLSRKINT